MAILDPISVPIDGVSSARVSGARVSGAGVRGAGAVNQPDLFSHPVLGSFHPAVREWFTRKFPLGPTPPQEDAWPSIAAGNDTLVAAPTGSGKTLSAFLVAIDQLYKRHDAGQLLPNTCQVMYVSPLKALAVDISENLEAPLTEIADLARSMGFEPPDLRVGVRSGDTTSSQRATMIRRPPNFIVTTPESLYLLLTAEKSREVLRTVDTVIIDEIHAVARDKRGSHLSLTLERLDHVCGEPPVRIGLSATQRPISTIARLLVGAGRCDANGKAQCTIVDSGHQRELDVALELPTCELEALAPAEQVAESLDRIAELVAEHHTTLVFVNTRRMAERLAHQLTERLGEDQVAAHHGSLSKDRRYRIERKLRAGELRVLVATASLELGIDIGPVELVCQIGSPRSLATFLQRVGRSGHSRHGTPKGRLFPFTRDELIECAALLAGVRAGRLDAVHPPPAPLDILAQQIVAETAAERWQVDDLYRLFTRAAPYADLTRETFDETLAFATDGIVTGRGARGAYVHHDAINNEAEGRRGARLAALTSGGAIPEIADYRVIADPDDTYVGSVNEDWATESMPGDIFLLGTHSWRIRRIEPGVVRVVDAQGQPPTIPFWLGEAPARTPELSDEVSSLRAAVQKHLEDEDPDGARAWVKATCGLDDTASELIISYLAASLAILGALPTTDRIIFERFFDESGGMQLVVHAPFGGRINRAFGLALRKKFCKNFDFELQAAANDDAIVLSLGPQHSFPLDEVQHYLKSDKITETLTQAVLVPPSPMFISRWRWNLNRSLTVLRFKGGRKNPPPIQRMEADDIMAAVFPSAAGCQENVTGPIEVPDHVIVRQTMYDTLNEGLAVQGLTDLVRRIESGDLEIVTCDSVEPSPLAHELLLGKPYTFLDDAEAIDRRTRAVPLRRGLPVDITEIGSVNPEAITQVADEAAPDVRTADELHDLLASLIRTPARDEWLEPMAQLVEKGRAVELRPGDESSLLWCTTEQHDVAVDLAGSTAEAEAARIETVRGHLDISGPLQVAEIATLVGLPDSSVTIALAALQSEGFVIEGKWRPTTLRTGDTEWCSRRLLARIHVYSQKRRRREIEPVTAQDFSRFLLRWHHLAPDSQVRGRAGLVAIIEQLQGYELAAGAWESVLADRVSGYKTQWLDDLCLGGDLAWGRLSADLSEDPGGRKAGPSRATPIALTTRHDLGWLMAAARGDSTPAIPEAGAAAEVIELLQRSGAQFHTELAAGTGRIPTDVETGLWEAVARGLVTADSFGAVRVLLDGRTRTTRRRELRRRGLRRGAAGHERAEGRWAMLPPPAVIEEPDELAEAVAEQLLARWGVVFRDIVQTESLAVPWREVLWAFRRLEARGIIRGGRFITGFAGEQYASPEALKMLRFVRKQPREGQRVQVRAVDPCNITGHILPGARIPSAGSRTITFIDGLPHYDSESVAHGLVPDDASVSASANGGLTVEPSGEQFGADDRERVLRTLVVGHKASEL